MLSAIDLFLDQALTVSDPKTVNQLISHAHEASMKIEAVIGFTRTYESFGTIDASWQNVFNGFEAAKMEIAYGTIIIQNLLPPFLFIYADPIIQKVYSTLLENSIRHGSNVKNIRILSSKGNDNLILIYEDDGSGIQNEEKELIFEHGFGDHTGIGLFLAKEILSITGLTIRENGEYGKGARFEIIVPDDKYKIE